MSGEKFAGASFSSVGSSMILPFCNGSCAKSWGEGGCKTKGTLPGHVGMRGECLDLPRLGKGRHATCELDVNASVGSMCVLLRAVR